MKKIISAFVMLLVTAGIGLAQEATISKVVKVAAAEQSQPLSATHARMTQFYDDDPFRGETFEVYWSASAPGLAPGATVIFEYVPQTAPGVHALHIQYDFKTVGGRKTVFTIPEKDFREGGNVKAWRVRVIRAGRLLAEQTSANWK